MIATLLSLEVGPEEPRLLSIPSVHKCEAIFQSLGISLQLPPSVTQETQVHVDTELSWVEPNSLPYHILHTWSLWHHVCFLKIIPF